MEYVKHVKMVIVEERIVVADTRIEAEEKFKNQEFRIGNTFEISILEERDIQ